MPLTDVLERLYARRRFGIKPGVDRVGKLLGLLGNPEKKFRSIHVVGTNGKGSTSAFLSSILKSAGHNVAQFSSPHLVRFTERFRINGNEYPAEKLIRSLEIVLAEAPEEATFFEITTALAAYIFAEEQIDLAVIEAGMGGRSDATAAFNGLMTIITPIALDHTDYLGSTIEDIALEKSGIIKPDGLVVSAAQPEGINKIITDQCRALNCSFKSLDHDFSASWNTDMTLCYNGINENFKELTPGIPGGYQSENAAVAIAAAELLNNIGINISSSSFIDGISSAYWPGRMELIAGTPPLLLDGAHNPAGAAALAKSLTTYKYSRLLMVTGVCDDKNYEQIYSPLIPLVDKVYTVTPSIDRGLNNEILSRFFSERSINAVACDSVAEGISLARNEATECDLILVCGSLFLVGEVKAWLEHENYNGIRG